MASTAYFGDKRLEKRFSVIREKIREATDSLITNCFKGRALQTGACRFFSNSKVTPEKIQAAHHPDLLRNIEGAEGLVLMIQDSSTFNYQTHPCTKNLGRIGTGVRPGHGVITHNSLCLDAHSNIALGLARQTFFHHAHESKTRNRPIEEKESYRWIEHLRHNHALCPRAVHICDREGDIFEFIAEANELQASFIIRQSHDRVLGVKMRGGKDGNILGRLKEAAVLGEYVQNVQGEAVRISVKAVSVVIAPAQRSALQLGGREHKCQPASVVQACGRMECGKEIHWTLLTSLPVESLPMCQKIVRCYAQRWHIELFHKALKTGFSLEEARLEDGDSLQKLISLVSIEAVRVYAILHAARLPEPAPPDTFLKPEDLEALTFLMQEEHPPALEKIVRFIAGHGGFIKTKKYPDPGLLTFFRGWNKIREQIYAVRLVWGKPSNGKDLCGVSASASICVE